MKRYSDTFFRYWLLIMIPVMILPLGEYLLARHPAPQIAVTADIYATQPITDGSSPWTTPAQVEAANLNEWLQSASFDYKVAMTSPIYARQLAHQWHAQITALNDLGQHLTVTTNGNNLVSISYQTLDGQEGLQVVQGLLNTANATTLSVSQWQQAIVGGYYTAQLHTAQQQEQQSTKALDDYMHNHNITPSEFALQLDSDPTFATLYNRNKTDQQNVNTLEQQVAASSGQPVSPITVASKQAYFVADQPTILLTYSTKKKLLTYVAIALVLGLLAGGMLLVLLTALDKTMRYAGEAQTMLSLPVLAVVAHSPLLDGRDARIAAKKLLPAHQIAELEQTG